jgi:hypothetical protein
LFLFERKYLKCPNCLFENQSKSQQCSCGFEFATGKVAKVSALAKGSETLVLASVALNILISTSILIDRGPGSMLGPGFPQMVISIVIGVFSIFLFVSMLVSFNDRRSKILGGAVLVACTLPWIAYGFRISLF